MSKIIKNKKILYVILLLIAFIISTSLSYAWFRFVVLGNDDSKNTIVQTGTLKLTFEDGDKIEAISIQPGWNKTKTFTVKNNGTFDATYSINLDVISNTFLNDELIYRITREGNVVGSGVVPSTTDILIDGIEIGVDEIHNYTIEFEFLEMSSEQNYNQGKEFNAKIQINESSFEDAEIISMFVDGASVEELDIDKLYKLTNYSCTNGEEVIFNSSSNDLIIRNFTKKTKCQVHFEEIKLWYEGCSSSSNSLNCKIITVADSMPQSDEDINFAQISSYTNGKGLYYTSNLELTEDYNNDGIGDRVYYYRGAVTNNNVRFGGYCWRIVRTNEDGSVRLRYNGTYTNGTCPVTGTDVKINNTTYKFYTSNTNNKYNEYVWVDGTGESDIKGTVEDWYENSGLINYKDQIANVPYCADKSNPITLTTGRTYYGAANRLLDYSGSSITTKSDAQPIYKCLDETGKHTAPNDTWGGTEKLLHPIGLLTADEVAFAGGTNADNQNFYLRINYGYWLMSPAYYRAETSYSYPFSLRAGGILSTSSAADANTGALPAVSLKPEVTVSDTGDGSYTNPYVVEN